MRHPLLIVYRYRLTPEALTAEDSVTQTVVDPLLAQPTLIEVVTHIVDRLGDWLAIEQRRIDQLALFAIKAFAPCGGVGRFATFWQNDLTYRQVKVPCESKVSRVVRWHRHDSACAIARQHIVADPDRDLLSRERVLCIRAGEDTRHRVIRLALTLCAALRTI